MSVKRTKPSAAISFPIDRCLFCLSKANDELNLGKLFKTKDFCVHYYCMLFSSGLRQGGQSDNDGILGFLPKDIRNEARRGSRLRCCYCKDKGATVGCCSRLCRRVFHLKCGIRNDSMHQFFGTFCSFCSKHRPSQAVAKYRHESSSVTCPICLSSVESRVSNSVLKSPCCNNSWFHRSCIQKQALNAGYFFKCPICNDQDAFQEEMLQFGIYIPQQDASWEREENAFQDLLFRHNRCDAKICHCPRGRKYDKENSKWEVKLCMLCGSQGIHQGCGRLKSIDCDWECSSCKDIMKKTKEPQVADDQSDSGGENKQKINETNLPPPTKVRKLSIPSDAHGSSAQHSTMHFIVSHDDSIVKLSIDDWSCLLRDAKRIRQKLFKQKTKYILWPDLKNDHLHSQNEIIDNQS